MKQYIVTQKIKALGLQAGDIFERVEDNIFCRNYRSGEKICIPMYILRDHANWFAPIAEKEECPHHKLKGEERKAVVKEMVKIIGRNNKLVKPKKIELIVKDPSRFVGISYYRELQSKINEIIGALNK